MRSLLVTKVYSAYDTKVNIKLLIFWQLKEKDLQLIYSPKLGEVQRAQSYYISEEWSIQRRISVTILLFISTGRRHNTFLFPRIKEWNLQRLPGKQASWVSLSKLLHSQKFSGFSMSLDSHRRNCKKPFPSFTHKLPNTSYHTLLFLKCLIGHNP